jgi:DNA-binding NtrC family response regulator
MDQLMAQPWPGNVRELANVIERAVVLCSGHEIGPEDLALTVPAAPQLAAPLPLSAPRRDFQTQVETFKQTIIKAALRETEATRPKPQSSWACSERTWWILRPEDTDSRDRVEAGG